MTVLTNNLDYSPDIPFDISENIYAKSCCLTNIRYNLQERLGVLPGNDDVRSGRNDQPVGDDAQQSGQAEAVQGGH